MFLLKLLGILLYGKDYEFIEQASQEKARKKSVENSLKGPPY